MDIESKKTYWISKEHWVCNSHFNIEKMKKSEGNCRQVGCLSVRPNYQDYLLRLKASEKSKESQVRHHRTVVQPEIAKGIEKKEESKRSLCAFSSCRRDNGERGYARSNSKYCHDNCRKAKARKKYRDRKKL
jgi:hypothetical protein